MIRKQFELLWAYWVLTLKFLGTIPLALFILYLRFGGGPEGSLFPPVITASAVLAIIGVSVLVLRKVHVNRLLFGSNLWIVILAVAFVQDWENTFNFIIELREVGFFVVIFIVGLFSVLFTDQGFVGVRHPDRYKQRLYGLYLLLATAMAIVVAAHFKGDILYGGSVPFIALSIVNGWLAHGLAGTRDTHTSISF